jgi:hypothetical protein
MRTTLRKWLTVLALVATYNPAMIAHNGPPFPIIVDQRIGPCVISLWTHPDIGIGTFWAMVDPLPGGRIPEDLHIRIGIQPVNGRLHEVIYATQREALRGQVQYKVEAPFDRQEFVRARVLVESSQGTGQAASTVEVTPVGLGRWDLLLFGLPFLGVGFLWFRAMTVSRNRRKKQLQHG